MKPIKTFFALILLMTLTAFGYSQIATDTNVIGDTITVVQDTLSTVPAVEPPMEELKDMSFNDLIGYFATPISLVALVLLLTGLLKLYVFKSAGFVTQVLSWLIAIALAFIGYFLKLGYLADLPNA